jgi:hypothetical protein
MKTDTNIYDVRAAITFEDFNLLLRKTEQNFETE